MYLYQVYEAYTCVRLEVTLDIILVTTQVFVRPSPRSPKWPALGKLADSVAVSADGIGTRYIARGRTYRRSLLSTYDVCM